MICNSKVLTQQDRYFRFVFLPIIRSTLAGHFAKTDPLKRGTRGCRSPAKLTDRWLKENFLCGSCYSTYRSRPQSVNYCPLSIAIAVACVAGTRKRCAKKRSERRRHASLPRTPLFFFWLITSMLLLHRLLAITDTKLYISTFRHKCFATIFHPL